MSESSFINECNFRYGITYNQPCPYEYGYKPHRKYGYRNFPIDAIRDDGMPYNVYAQPLRPSCCCPSCIKRFNNELAANIVNIESSIDRVLTIKLYGTSKDLDKTIRMVIGNKYAVTHITENGFETSTGTLGEISANIPDDCVKYVGNYNTAVSSAYIGLDCSTDGKSDKRLIYIAAIRYIEPVYDDDQDQYPELTSEEKLNMMLSTLSSSITTIEEYITENTKPEEEEEEEEKDDPPPPHHPPKPWDPYLRPGPYQGPLIVGQMHPYPPAMGYGPGRPGLMNPINHPPKKPEKESSVSLDDILEAMGNIKTLLSSYIAQLSEDPEMCGCCNLEAFENIINKALSKEEEKDDTENSNDD